MSDVIDSVNGGFGNATAGIGFTTGMRGEALFGGGTGSAQQALTLVKSTAAVIGSATGPIGGVASSVIGIVADAVKDGISAYDTQKTVARLTQIQGTLGSTGDEGKLKEVLGYAIAKKTSLRDRSIASATVVAKPFVGIHNAGKFLYKKAAGTQGKGRDSAADDLLKLAETGSPKAAKAAREAIAALTMQSFDQIMKNSVKESLRSS